MKIEEPDTMGKFIKIQGQISAGDESINSGTVPRKRGHLVTLH